jgi:hypothetical protein
MRISLEPKPELDLGTGLTLEPETYLAYKSPPACLHILRGH